MRVAAFKDLTAEAAGQEVVPFAYISNGLPVATWLLHSMFSIAFELDIPPW